LVTQERFNRNSGLKNKNIVLKICGNLNQIAKKFKLKID